MITIRRKGEVDWFRILVQLRTAGLSHNAVARIIHVPRTRVRNWGNGQRPRYEDGRALMLLWRRVMLAQRRKQAEKVQQGTVQRILDASPRNTNSERMATAALPVPVVALP